LFSWSGIVSPAAAVISYQAQVTAVGPRHITNIAEATAAGYARVTASTWFVANGYAANLPAVMRR
jgi:hypothetical protein